MPKVSVIVPVYNAFYTLDKCLNSLVNQTLEDIEIIVINDGSLDDSQKIIDKYEKKYKNKVIPFKWKNHGIGMTRNKGIELARGKYVCFVDSDDYVSDDFLENMYNDLLYNDADMAICDLYRVNDNGIVSEVININDDIKIIDLKKNPEIINKLEFGPCTKLFKKELFNGNNFLTDLKFEDLVPVFVALLKAKKTIKVNKKLYYYYINENGETKTNDKRNFDMLNVLKILNENIKKYDYEKELKKYFEEFCVYRLYASIYQTVEIDDKNKLYNFIYDSIKFLNNNFKGWKKRYNIPFVKKIIVTNPALYKLYIQFRFR